MPLNVQHQNLVELGDRFGRPIVLPHQYFTGTLCEPAIRSALRFVAKAFCQGVLQVKHQPVFTTFGQHVESGSNQAEHSLVAFNLLHFKRSRQTFVRQIVPGFAETCSPCHPQNNL